MQAPTPCVATKTQQRHDTMTPTEAIAEIRKLKTADEVTEYSRSLPKELRYSYEVQSQLRLRAMQIFHETVDTADTRPAYAYPWAYNDQNK